MSVCGGVGDGCGYENRWCEVWKVGADYGGWRIEGVEREGVRKGRV